MIIHTKFHKYIYNKIKNGKYDLLPKGGPLDVGRINSPSLGEEGHISTPERYTSIKF